MFAKLAIVALASFSCVAAAPISCARTKTSTPDKGKLESYAIYHARYIALSCHTQQNTTFFDDCCHPLAANQTIDSLKPSCAINSSAISSVTATATVTEATAVVTDPADIEAASEYLNASSAAEEVSSVASATKAASPVTSTAVVSPLGNVAELAKHSRPASSYETEATSTASWEEESTSSWEKPTSTSSTAEETASSTGSSAESSATSGSSGSSGETHTGGFATFFTQGGVAGACGTVHSDDDYVIAIDTNGWWGNYQSDNNSQYCGKKIYLTNTNNGKSVTAVVADACPSCVSNNSLDLSVGAFKQIATEEDGMVPIEWRFVD
ncbi:uncharacterized protein L203_105989 [Cryptococcus depauperatus CBS 7841]|uniref:Uncharacterized protein n=1 Tax=Cryptococcus depauperatus CBS 7841 TaxID=1295531 RepID=A0A1E3IV04_9TREE|nr:hypothetical protein L203_00696 [Cryptococcus depauperatus CBS 7841]